MGEFRDNDHKVTGYMDGNTFRDANHKAVWYMDGDTIRGSENHKVIGFRDGNTIRNTNHKTILYLDGGTVRNADHKAVGYMGGEPDWLKNYNDPYSRLKSSADHLADLMLQKPPEKKDYGGPEVYRAIEAEMEQYDALLSARKREGRIEIEIPRPRRAIKRELITCENDLAEENFKLSRAVPPPNADSTDYKRTETLRQSILGHISIIRERTEKLDKEYNERLDYDLNPSEYIRQLELITDKANREADTANREELRKRRISGTLNSIGIVLLLFALGAYIYCFFGTTLVRELHIQFFTSTFSYSHMLWFFPTVTYQAANLFTQLHGIYIMLFFCSCGVGLISLLFIRKNNKVNCGMLIAGISLFQAITLIVWNISTASGMLDNDVSDHNGATSIWFIILFLLVHFVVALPGIIISLRGFRYQES